MTPKFFEKSQVEGPEFSIRGFACKGDYKHGKVEVVCNKHGGDQLVKYRGVAN